MTIRCVRVRYMKRPHRFAFSRPAPEPLPSFVFTVRQRPSHKGSGAMAMFRASEREDKHNQEVRKRIRLGELLTDDEYRTLSVDLQENYHEFRKYRREVQKQAKHQEQRKRIVDGTVTPEESDNFTQDLKLDYEEWVKYQATYQAYIKTELEDVNEQIADMQQQMIDTSELLKAIKFPYALHHNLGPVGPDRHYFNVRNKDWVKHVLDLGSVTTWEAKQWLKTQQQALEKLLARLRRLRAREGNYIKHDRA
jgi:hypothetical protein